MPESPRRPLHLNAFLLGVGHHEAAWRSPGAEPRAPLGLDHYLTMAEIAESARFDSLFLADVLSIGHQLRHNNFLQLDPLGVLFALAGRTSHIGLIGTASTTYGQPYDLARRFASLDHLSGGRAGWNIVTSCTDAEARNFGHDAQLDHGTRYLRAEDFLAAARKLWDSWDEDALVLEKESGVYADPGRIRPAEHRGEWYRVAGPLNLPRSPQGHPVLVQAGSSEDGREFAARHAEAVFTAHQSLASARDFYRDLKGRARALGRGPREPLIFPGIVPIIGDSPAAARRRREELDRLIVTDYALQQLSDIFEHDLSGLPLDGPFPDLVDRLPSVQGNRSRATLIAETARRESLTLREAIARLGAGRGHYVLTGTPVEIADRLQEWFLGEAADGFNVMCASLPGDLELFAERVVPVLRQRGLVRAEYGATTLRGHYGAAGGSTATRDPTTDSESLRPPITG